MIDRTEFDLIRQQIAVIGSQLIIIKANVQVLDVPKGADRGEMIANMMLAYRHLEDARMRTGKVIQALEGGASAYDKPAKVVAPAELAERSYNAYCNKRGWKSFNGDLLPPYVEQKPELKEAWEAAATANL